MKTLHDLQKIHKELTEFSEGNPEILISDIQKNVNKNCIYYNFLVFCTKGEIYNILCFSEKHSFNGITRINKKHGEISLQNLNLEVSFLAIEEIKP